VRVPMLCGVAMLEFPVCIAFSIDLTERMDAARTLRQTEEQLRQAQKMEAVGRLAGGIAHDFNNLLSVVLSCAEMVLDDLAAGDPRREDVNDILCAGQRAAGLTRQLLMFSRQQVLEPRILDLNETLENMDKILTRVLGEDIELVTHRAETLGRIRADPSSLEQVIMNLAVNARDAMPTGGRLTLETANADLNDEQRRRIGLQPGPHVMIAVTDTGTGMDAATQLRIFEPFFTTKPKEKGTGLGLSTVFGIVHQTGGAIAVASELGVGTTFSVYLPCVAGEVERDRVARPTVVGPGTETILLVEDEDQVRVVARNLLTRQGYQVIDVSTAAEAIARCEHHDGTIDLLLTDVVMPHMGGPELAKRLEQIRPHMKVLCMSGYTDDSVVRYGIFTSSIAFLQKPITPDSLARKVREVLDTSAKPSSSGPN
jgi:two-component system, cell cycle sensor histidine kinase and response regulator CckA